MADQQVTAVQKANRFWNALNSSSNGGPPSYGVWQMLPGTNISRCLASGGFDWIMVDCEHGNIDDSMMHELVPTIAACGVSPLVRVPDFQSWMAKRALDCGAHGILAPLIRSVSDAQTFAQACRFPPAGRRGFGSPFSMGNFKANVSSTEYLKQANSGIVVAIQIETKEALDSVEEIAAIDGIDLLFVGPFDLGNNIGHPITGPQMDDELQAAIKRVLDAAKKAGKKSGMFCTSGAECAPFAKMGFNMINVATDVVLLAGGAAAGLKAAQSAN